MVISGGVRSFVQAAAVCALALSALPAIQAKKGPAAALTPCTASDGDKSFGIQAIEDESCAKGGLGCFDKHCRYCKVLDTPKSSHLDTCLSYGVAFTSTTTVPVTQGPCEVSSSNVAAGISAVTDSGCLRGGLGCYNDHCRYCKLVKTPQSAGFMPCSSLDGSYGVPIDITAAPATAAPTVPATVAPATAAPTVPATDVLAPVQIEPVTEAPAVLVDVPSLAPPAVTTDPPTITTYAPAADVTCTVVASVGDAEAGINIVTDFSCASGGFGCLSDVCRLCKVQTTPQSDAYMDCALINGVAPATEEPTAIPAATVATPSVISAAETEAPDTTIPVATDATAEAPVDTTEVPLSTNAAPDATVETPASTTDFPVDVAEIPGADSTGEPSVTPVVSTEVPVSTTGTPVEPPVSTCTLVASDEDSGFGMSVATDSSCRLGGVGCINEICRFCKVTTSLQSAPYVDCASLQGWSQQAEAPVADATDAPSEVPTETPGATTEVPTATIVTPAVVPDTPDVTTEAPLVVTDVPDATTEPAATETPSASIDLPVHETCGIDATAGDIAVGVHIATDATCSAGGLGCINDLCRFCKVETTPQSVAFVDCSSIAGFASDSAASVDAPITTPVATIPASCDVVASTGDAAAGVRIVTDTTCSVGGVGCISDVCRFCKVITSIQSADFIDCVMVNGYTPEPVATPIATPDVTITAPISEESCTQIASEGDLAVGVDIVTDATCRTGGVGCIDSVCRFCQVASTPQSVAFVNCTSLPGYTPRSEAPVDVSTMAPSGSATGAPVAQSSCDLAVSASDAAVGISITGDATCAAGGVGCIDSVCRFCKLETTVQSAAFVDCPVISSPAAPVPETPVDTIATNIPRTTLAAGVTEEPATGDDTGASIAPIDLSATNSNVGDSSASTDDEPVDIPDTASDAVDATPGDDRDADAEAPPADVDTELPQDVEGPDDDHDDSLIEGPAANVTDDSDLLTELPADPPTKVPTPTMDDFDDNWEGSDEASDADSDSTYDESLDGI